MRVPPSTVDPARDAAALLRRLGFLVLFVGCPLGTLASRNGAVIVFSIGVALVIAAAIFDGAARPLRHGLAQVAAAPAAVAVAIFAGWALLSLAWTPSPRAGSLPGTGLVIALGLAAFLALPDRMRASNLYLVPIGAAVASAAAFLLVLTTRGDADPEGARRVERGLSVLVLYAWPAIAWLRSRGRDVEAVILAALAAVAAALGPGSAPILAFAFGAVAYLLAAAFDGRGASLVGLLLAAAIVLAPALVLWGLPALGPGGRLADWAAGMAPWREVIGREPTRLITGHGIGALRNAGDGLRLSRSVGAPALALWYEFGIVGALSIAAALATAPRYVASSFGPLLPGLAGAVATAWGLSMAGIDGGETWWVAALSLAALAFVAAERGQFRTRRPRAGGFGRSRAP